MISRLYRFHGYNALRFVYKQGRTVRIEGAPFTLRYVANPRRQQYRLAVVVSKKQSKSAVVRNRIRRRLYEAGRELLTDRAGALDLVLSVTDERVATMDKKDINKIILSFLQIIKPGEGR